MKILSPSISRPVWMCLFWTQGKIFWRMWDTEQYFFLTMEVNGDPKQPDYTLSSEYLPLCSAEQTHSYRSGNTWGWVNDDRISIFGWAVPLNERWGERSIQTEGWRHCLHGQGFYARFVFVVYLHSEMITDERASDTTWKSKQCYQHIHPCLKQKKEDFLRCLRVYVGTLWVSLHSKSN